MDSGFTRPQVVPLMRLNAAETLTILGEAMGFAGPAAAERAYARPYPVDADESANAAMLYATIRDAQARQAILDVLVAIVLHNRSTA